MASLNSYQSAVYHDSIEGNIYVSSNEGRTWTLPEDIPRGVAAMVIEHPFDASLVRSRSIFGLAYSFMLPRHSS
jgi:hypothetical protein